MKYKNKKVIVVIVCDPNSNWLDKKNLHCDLCNFLKYKKIIICGSSGEIGPIVSIP